MKRTVDRSSEFDQTAEHVHGGEDCPACQPPRCEQVSPLGAGYNCFMPKGHFGPCRIGPFSASRADPLEQPHPDGPPPVEIGDEGSEPEKVNTPTTSLFHRLWTKAVGTAGYENAEWCELDNYIQHLEQTGGRHDLTLQMLVEDQARCLRAADEKLIGFERITIGLAKFIDQVNADMIHYTGKSFEEWVLDQQAREVAEDATPLRAA